MGESPKNACNLEWRWRISASRDPSTGPTYCWVAFAYRSEKGKDRVQYLAIPDKTMPASELAGRGKDYAVRT